MKAIALSAVLGFVGIAGACRQQSGFEGKTRVPVKPIAGPAQPAEKKPVDESDALAHRSTTPTPSDLVLPCSFQSTSPSPAPIAATAIPSIVALATQSQVLIPAECPRTAVQKADPNRGLDLVFVLDVTGSMRSQLDLILSQFKSMVSTLTAAGWNLHIGALAVADDVIGTIPLSADTNAVLAAMGPQNVEWSALPGFGGDLPEQGLLGLQCALNVLADDSTCDRTTGIVPKPTSLARDKAVVYVSDAPARDFKGRFAVADLAEKWKGFSFQLNTLENSSLRLFHAVSSSRKGLFDDMPTPSEQITEFAKQAGVSTHALGYPMSAASFKSELLDRLSEGKLVTQMCTLISYEIVQDDGKAVVPPTPLLDTDLGADLSKASQESKIAPVFLALPSKKWAKGKLTLNTRYECNKEIQNSSVSFTL